MQIKLLFYVNQLILHSRVVARDTMWKRKEIHNILVLSQSIHP